MQINASKFDHIARNVFAPVYPIIARQIVDHTGVHQGVGLDIGCGPGYLGAALAKITRLYIHFFDRSSEMLEIAKRTIGENKLEQRADTLKGDVLSLKFADESVDLAVSRGSIFFWQEVSQALKEIYRVLAPNGWAYIGGGFGSKELFESITEKMDVHDNGDNRFKNRVSRNLSRESYDRFKEALQTAGIKSAYILQNDEIGMWVVMKKQSRPVAA